MGDEQMTQEQKGKTPVLDVQNLTKIYDNGGKGDGNEVLKNVNFTMNEGEFVCILGPSGCGKTTFLRCIGGFETFDGTVKVNGKACLLPSFPSSSSCCLCKQCSPHTLLSAAS